jgi:hypothetical protein
MNEQLKKNLKNASLFTIGVIVTLVITMVWNKVFPTDPIIIKEVTDSVKVIHNFEIPSASDSLTDQLEKSLKNLKTLNEYEAEIDKRVKRIQEKGTDFIYPNLILLDSTRKYEMKGFVQEEASAFFTLDCPKDVDSKTLDFRIDFFNPKTIEEIAFLRLNIYRFAKIADANSQYYYLNEIYEVRPNNNLIRIENNLGKGKFEVFIGFTFKRDLKAKYPGFYFKRCMIYKN